MIRRIRNIAFVILLVTLSIAVTQDLKASGCSPWNCNIVYCSGTCESCAAGYQACQEFCSLGYTENFQCQEHVEGGADVFCQCYFPE